MATYRIPNRTGQIRQIGKGDRYGELWATRNIDLTTSPGKIKLARPVEQIMDETDLVDDRIEAIELFDGKIFALTEAKLFSDGTPYNAFTTASSDPASAQDMVVFDGELRIVDDTDVDRFDGSAYNSSWWQSTINGTALNANYPHVLEVVRNSGRDTIAVTDGARLRYYNVTAGHSTFTWDSDQIACCQTAGLNRGWIGTYTESAAGAQVISWAVGDDQYRQAYPVNAYAVLAMTIFDNVPFAITEKGEILKFNQAGFTPIARLPFWRETNVLGGAVTGLIQRNNTQRPVHPKGMKVVGDKIWVYVNTIDDDGNENVNGRSPAGVWEIDPVSGSATHLYSVGNTVKLVSSSPLFVINDDNSRVYFGGDIDSLTGTGLYGLYREDLSGSANYGYYVTTEMHSESFEEHFNNVYLGALQDENDKLVVKYRASQSLSLPIQADVTWTSTTQFNTTADLSAVSVGDEVEILTDAGDGRCAHISKLEASSSTYSITIDEAIGTSGEQSSVQFDNWTKLDTYDTTQLVKRIGINETNTSVQIKVYMEGDSGYPEISRMVVKSNNKKELK